MIHARQTIIKSRSPERLGDAGLPLLPKGISENGQTEERLQDKHNP